MSLTYEELGAIFRVCVYVMNADGGITPEEVVPFRKFIYRFEGFTREEVNEVMRIGQQEVSDQRALQLIAAFDDETKVEVANLLAEVAVINGEYSAKEEELLNAMVEACGLPQPVIEGQGEDQIPPLFIVVKTNGKVNLCVADSNEWSDVEAAVAPAIGAERLEVVRFTPRLKQLTYDLGLVRSHLVFLMDRNAALKEDARDNMTGTVLYGTGYEIMGNIAFCLETDEGYNVVGIESMKKAMEIFDAINDAVSEMLTLEE